MHDSPDPQSVPVGRDFVDEIGTHVGPAPLLRRSSLVTTQAEATARPNPRPARQKSWKWWQPVASLLVLGAVAVAVEYRP
ncbi:hypothetical protein ACYOEI_41350, partial [Singulisphaera rosea]